MHSTSAGRMADAATVAGQQQDSSTNVSGANVDINANNPLSRKLKKVLDTRLDNDKVVFRKTTVLTFLF